MKLSKGLVLVSIFVGMVFVLASCGILPQSQQGTISGRVLIPPSEMSKDITGWVPAANAIVTITDADGIIHTITTDDNGYYTFEGIAVNANTVITATVELNGDTLVFKDVIPQAVAADEDYDSGDMDPESTALALVLEALIASGEDPSDIDLDEIESNSYFSDLVEKIAKVHEEGDNVAENPDVAALIADIISPPTPPSPSQGSTPKLPVYNQTKKTYHDTIQKAIDASGSGDIIVVSKGTYNENILIDNKNITLKSSDPADSATVAATIIDGQDLNSVIKILNGDKSTLEGFTIQNGNEPVYGGGGIFIFGSSPVIRYNIIGDNIDDDIDTGNFGDCGGGIGVVEYSETPHIYENTIIGNSADYGGGMFVGYGSPLVENNTIKENTSKYDGGGIVVFYSKKEGYCPTIRDNTIEYNVADNGGGIAVDDFGDAIIENNGINNNEAKYDGGGIYVYYKGDACIEEGNTIQNNKAGYQGGGIYVYSDGTIVIDENTISNNTTVGAGGGVLVTDSTITVSGNTISNNISEDYGGGMALYDSTITIEDNKISGNTAISDGGGIDEGGCDGSIHRNIITQNTSENSSGGGICVFVGDDGSDVTIGGVDSTDTDHFNTICGNSPEQVNPDDYPHNYISEMCQYAVVNGDFETGDLSGWIVKTSGSFPQVQNSEIYSGDYTAYLGTATGMNDGDAYLKQTVCIPSDAVNPLLTLYYKVDGPINQLFPDYWDEMYVIINDSDQILCVRAITYDEDGTSGWVKFEYGLDDYSDTCINLKVVTGTINNTLSIHFYVDDISITWD